jgi:hypothetical protein
MRLNRVWSILPGVLTWGTIIGLLLLTFTNPPALVIAVLLYAVYWLIKIFIMTGFLVAGFLRYRRDGAVDWEAKLKKDFPDQWPSLYHLAIIPSYKEDISILRHTLDSIKNSHYPNDRLIVVVAFERREKDLAPGYAPILIKEYEHQFSHFAITFHPEDIAGEVRGKGPNITWAARQIKPYLEKAKLPFDRVITTTLDADNRVHPNYFANVSWAYLNDPDPYHKSFQPLPMFFNNIWQVPLPVKITALGSSFWQIVQGMRPHHARNFSAHAQSFAALVATDFWSVHTVVEDGHQYWRSFFAFKGNHSIIPIFVPVYMDAVQGDNLLDTFEQQYLQRRRWFWGVSDIPYVFDHVISDHEIPFFYKWLQLLRLIESHYSLATQSFILLIGWLPLAINPSFGQTVLGYNFPTVYRGMLLAAWVGMIGNMSVASLIVPPRPGRRIVHLAVLLKEWILAPITLSLCGIIFSSIPAIDSQTRLMLNKPFTTFNVTKKIAIPSGILRVGN